MKKMNCKKVKKQLFFYLENSLAEKQKKLLENHLQQCPACEKELEKIKKLIVLLKDNQISVKIPPNYIEKILSQIKEQKKQRTSLVFRWAGALAGILLILGGVYFYQIHQNQLDPLYLTIQTLKNEISKNPSLNSENLEKILIENYNLLTLIQIEPTSENLSYLLTRLDNYFAENLNQLPELEKYTKNLSLEEKEILINEISKLESEKYFCALVNFE